MDARLSPDDFLRYLQAQVQQHGSQKQAAAAWRVSCAYLNDVLHRRRDPAGKLLTALGFGREVWYVERQDDMKE